MTHTQESKQVQDTLSSLIEFIFATNKQYFNQAEYKEAILRLKEVRTLELLELNLEYSLNTTNQVLFSSTQQQLKEVIKSLEDKLSKILLDKYLAR